ncbi:hypothetical protein GUITHDRAFT_107005 [Guillardia theta CCMP2712]|uniref:Uncharacterized protein n=1 Tax=Guillardia theta (strain CCMP2712) TaxID=905079 RepID=L1JEX3_GUITC|nr:hypothetical protein GUITHDRAFT_107005 [Guillardia theta CCMP2712]EKX47093.1 hypothetical protein GUITHDRAFT_107005 [Guillardia theta CCMP2712]|eukprot:XP_005834073.1 hypothetical protein GUITHDRAFT_107005 [Guillardia theta CCMP2712]
MARRQEHDIKVSVEERVSSASRCSCHKAKERIIASLEQACGHDLPATLPDDLRDVDEDDLEPLPPSCCCEGFNAPDLHEVVEAVKRMKTKDVSTMLDHLLCLKCEHELKFHRPLLEVRLLLVFD